MVAVDMLASVLPPAHWVSVLTGHWTPRLEHSLGCEEGRRGLYHIDVLVEVQRQRPLRSAVDGGSSVVLELGVLGLQKLLGLRDRNGDGDPILSWSVVEVLNTVLGEPLVHHVHTVVVRADDVGDLLGGQMLAIASMAWVRHLDEMALHNALVALLDTDLEVDGLGLVGLANGGPGARNMVALFDRVSG